MSGSTSGTRVAPTLRGSSTSRFARIERALQPFNRSLYQPRFSPMSNVAVYPLAGSPLAFSSSWLPPLR
jgi:hypothetical protein